MPGPQATTAGAEEFATALRTAIADRGLSLERIRHHLSQHGHELSVATLSYWQSGRSRPDRATSLAALAAIESILELREGELSSLLPARRRRTAAQSQRLQSVAEVDEQGQVVDRLLRQLGLSVHNGLERVSLHETIRVGRNMGHGGHRVREVVRADVDGAVRWPLWFHREAPRATPMIAPSHNCHLGRVIEVPDRALIVAEMVLDEPLARGESVIVEYHYSLGNDSEPMTQWKRVCMRRIRELHMEVQFDPACLPLSAESFTIHDDVRRSEPILVAGDLISMLQLDFGPAATGLSWRW